MQVERDQQRFRGGLAVELKRSRMRRVSSVARPSPIRESTHGLMTAGTRPTRTSLMQKVAPASAMTMSLAAQRPTPPAYTAPRATATTGSGVERIAR